MAYLSKPPRTLADRDEELYAWLCRTLDDLNAENARLEARVRQLERDEALIVYLRALLGVQQDADRRREARLREIEQREKDLEGVR